MGTGISTNADGSFIYTTSRLHTFRTNGEVNIPFEWYLPQTLTAGVEWVDTHFTDTASTTDSATSALATVLTSGDRSKMHSSIASVYLEDNMKLTDTTDAAFSLRFDDYNRSGSSWSPGLNLTQQLGEYFTVKGGIAKAYKTPNLYQNAEGYLLASNGGVVQ